MPMKYRSRRARAGRSNRLRRYNRSRRLVARRYPVGAIKNYFKYSRYCADTTITNNGVDEVKWVDAPTNYTLGTVVPDDNGLNQFGGVMSFQLNDVIDKSDFTNLYDRYTVKGAKITFISLSNQGYVGTSSSGNQNSATIPTMTYAVDYDDTTLPTTSLDILEKMDAKVRRLDRPFSIYIKNPKVTSLVYSDTGAVAAGIGSRGFYNCANDNIVFHGLKFWIRDMELPDPTKNLNSLIRVQVKLYLAFKDPQ